MAAFSSAPTAKPPHCIAATDDENLAVVTAGRQRRIERRGDDRAFDAVITLSRDNHRSAARQQARDRFPGVATHDDVVPHRDRFEHLQFAGQVPRYRLIRTDDAIFRHRNNQRDTRRLLAHYARALNRNRCLDRGMRVVILEREILILEVEEIFHRRI